MYQIWLYYENGLLQTSKHSPFLPFYFPGDRLSGGQTNYFLATWCIFEVIFQVFIKLWDFLLCRRGRKLNKIKRSLRSRLHFLDQHHMIISLDIITGLRSSGMPVRIDQRAWKSPRMIFSCTKKSLNYGLKITRQVLKPAFLDHTQRVSFSVHDTVSLSKEDWTEDGLEKSF